ncbi:MAG TPA: hypothetical protein VGQ09_20375 [Chitinophagaceae bacterium]|jgi:hypothetical protein|nr:hypothetical protein [Chitinophagaceae bacterium]
MRMMMVAICIMLSITLCAQDSTLIFIPADRNVTEVLKPDKIYRFPKFTEGKIFFKDGSWSKARLNYNFLNGEIEFIGAGNDTLAIAKNQMLNIKEVLIDSQSFVYNNVYMELAAKSDLGKLYKEQVYVVIKREKIGGYNQPNPTSAIDSYESFPNYNGNLASLKIRENITLALKTNYFISKDFNLFLPATKNNMMNLYRSKKDQIKSYLNQNPVDFKNGNHLKRMFESL